MALTEKAGRLFEFLRRRKINYQLAKGSGFDVAQPATQDMLIDLANFCRANETCIVLDTTGKIDVERTFVLEGRREVWLRMQQHFNLSAQQLYQLYTGKQFNPGDDHE